MSDVALGYNEAITIDQVISSARADLGLIDNSFYDVLLEKWICEGARHLSTNQLFVKKPATLTVINKKATLPSDFRRMLGLRYSVDVQLERADGAIETVTRCIPMTYVDKQFAADCGCDSNTLNGWGNFLASYEIIGNEIICRQDVVDGSNLELSYLGLATDDNCLLIIRPDFERALSAYARTKFLQAYPEVKGQFTGMLLAEAKREWVNQKDWVKAQAVVNEFINNRYQIVALAKAWFVRNNYSAGAQY